MGPRSNPELFGAVEPSVIDRLGEEEMRRVSIGGTLSDLSEAFVSGDVGPSSIITEPVMVPKLMALAAIQRTHLGVAGFEPKVAIGFEDDSARVRAYPAQPHDSFVTTNGSPVSTRAIQLDIEHGYTESGDSPIEIYGLNLFIPDPDVDVAFGEEDKEPTSKLLVVGDSGRVTTSAEASITGETPIIAVRNKRTGDAKVYMIRIVGADAMPDEFDTQQMVTRSRTGAPVVQDNVAWVESGGQIVKIECLTDSNQLNAVAGEFENARQMLRDSSGNQLSNAERTALGSLR